MTFEETLRINFLLVTPSGVSSNEVRSVFSAAKWHCYVEIAFDVAGRILNPRIDNEPECLDGGLAWRVEADFTLDLTPWDELDPEFYSSSDTLDTFGIDAKLPEDWEITEYSYHQL